MKYIYICIFTLIIPYPSTSISLFRPHISAHHSTSQGHHASCRCGGWMPVHRIGMGNGPRPTCSSCGSWSTLDSQAKRGGVMFHMFPCLSFILICFNIVCVCLLCLVWIKILFETTKWSQWFHVRLFERKKQYVERTLIWKQIILRLLIIPWIYAPTSNSHHQNSYIHFCSESL